MKMEIDLNIDFKAFEGQVKAAAQKAMRDTVGLVATDAIQLSPKLTGTNAHSIKYEVGPGGEFAKEEISGAVYSTSGYGGYLETGTSKMGAQPYMRPALDLHFSADKFADKIKRHLR